MIAAGVSSRTATVTGTSTCNGPLARSTVTVPANSPPGSGSAITVTIPTGGRGPLVAVVALVLIVGGGAAGFLVIGPRIKGGGGGGGGQKTGGKSGV